jgi:hypothetical protein
MHGGASGLRARATCRIVLDLGADRRCLLGVRDDHDLAARGVFRRDLSVVGLALGAGAIAERLAVELELVFLIRFVQVLEGIVELGGDLVGDDHGGRFAGLSREGTFERNVSLFFFELYEEEGVGREREKPEKEKRRRRRKEREATKTKSGLPWLVSRCRFLRGRSLRSTSR